MFSAVLTKNNWMRMPINFDELFVQLVPDRPTTS